MEQSFNLTSSTPTVSKAEVDEIKKIVSENQISTIKENNLSKNQTTLRDSNDWNTNDDEFLVELRTLYKSDWKKIARRILSVKRIRRTVGFLKKRYNELQGPAKDKKLRFSHSEDLQLVDGIQKLGFDWMKISQTMNGRDPISLKNRYYSFLKKDDNQTKILQELTEMKRRESEVEKNFAFRPSISLDKTGENTKSDSSFANILNKEYENMNKEASQTGGE